MFWRLTPIDFKSKKSIQDSLDFFSVVHKIDNKGISIKCFWGRSKLRIMDWRLVFAQDFSGQDFSGIDFSGQNNPTKIQVKNNKFTRNKTLFA